MRNTTFLILILLFLGFTAQSQKPFEDEIKAFRQQDSVQFPGKGKILFIGSSSFRLWKDVQTDFPTHPIINRGFGGANFTDLLLYKDQIVNPYSPRQVVIYCGENDLAQGTEPEKVFENFKILFSYIRGVAPQAHIAFVSIKPSPSRKPILENVKRTNRMIKDFLGKQKRAVYVDTFSLMLQQNGDFREELFVEDRLHMNRKGYDIWKAALEPHLL
jgi:lysophospholipase L1-like esterase